MNLKEIFINNLKYYRKQKGMTQNELTLALNKSYNYINSVEQGKILPSFEVIEQICEALEIRPTQLFGDDSSPQNVMLFSKDSYVEEVTEKLLTRLKPFISQEIKNALR
mgnify:CR=1 FL=1